MLGRAHMRIRTLIYKKYPACTSVQAGYFEPREKVTESGIVMGRTQKKLIVLSREG